MRIKADFDLCESNAICVGMAPDFFDLDDDDYLVILQEEIPADRVEELRQVAANCPKSALSVEED
ncbi:ferredoxin [Gordonia westfalica]|uniref:Ferredoxin n=2 Tax=Gordonia TaxID=2053 RepID=A0A1H2LM49_9ACTN|nr:MULTISPECIES: ferredoxin [Gordonia]AZZ81055.1 ferredoxin [Gordonia alkanivorans]MCK8612751.1 ferredoxin [Gordonia sp. C13]MDS1113122.1 ferredoxin [Gordonia westfalica]SDU81835.1 ferredoxin [Gordonia westfalica]GAB99992.1 putative 3Fe-4S ferredoxin [Gordonia namibiensis NBRC 108229]